MRHLRLSAPDGVRYRPDEPSGVGVLALAGSSGRVDGERARVLAEQGALSESIRWFGGPGQSPGPWDVPVELFLERVEELRRECDRVVVCGTSFGAEAALLTGAFSSSVDAVAAFAPSDVVWSGVTPDGRSASHWTFDGRPLPCVALSASWRPDRDPPRFTELYRQSYGAAGKETIAAATIPVERVPEVVLVAGGDDRVWPSQEHAARVVARRQRHGLSTVVVRDDEAGHRTILPGERPVVGGARMERGGSEAADRRLGAAAWSHLLRLIGR
ncbi:acyl-CoA thioester hydrolase/BAAT C-terminal domain-containing protein [Desertihabitans brevis]|uniref:acyl-CoA thioester hydrolase/BAAT C-terminal domain-containing protein n=1 Tax=Desertihabitans brevis TaxID=2268447 RepID=UPI001314DBC1|nr:acyl-CoA thioester hydrolase/BAAT C-terminal domain-containing protein [Desertihabitans brevis]